MLQCFSLIRIQTDLHDFLCTFFIDDRRNRDKQILQSVLPVQIDTDGKNPVFVEHDRLDNRSYRGRDTVGRIVLAAENLPAGLNRLFTEFLEGFILRSGRVVRHNVSHVLTTDRRRGPCDNLTVAMLAHDKRLYALGIKIVQLCQRAGKTRTVQCGAAADNLFLRKA